MAQAQSEVGCGDCNNIDVKDVGKTFAGVISLLRFFRRINRLGEVDKFASAPDADALVRILKDLMSWVYRNAKRENGKLVCFSEDVRSEREAEVYEFLCGKHCVVRSGGSARVVVRCPRLPSECEVSLLYQCVREGKVKPELIAALALSRARR